jgi:hypothetical protein
MDGTWKPGVRIATNCFTKEEVELLALALETKFNLKCTLHKNNNKYQLYIKQESLPLLKKLVLPYIHIPTLKYKIGLGTRSNSYYNRNIVNNNIFRKVNHEKKNSRE